jgi:hypothetical protein
MPKTEINVKLFKSAFFRFVNSIYLTNGSRFFKNLNGTSLRDLKLEAEIESDFKKEY